MVVKKELDELLSGLKVNIDIKSFIVAPEAIHSDHRRDLIQLITKDFKQINHCIVKPNKLIGKHSHNSAEYFFFILGEGQFKLKEKNIIYTYGTYPGLFILVPSNYYHEFKSISRCEFLTFSTEIFKENSFNEKPTSSINHNNSKKS